MEEYRLKVTECACYCIFVLNSIEAMQEVHKNLKNSKLNLINFDPSKQGMFSERSSKVLSKLRRNVLK